MNEQKGTSGEMYRLNELYNTVLKATNDAVWEWDIPNDKLIWSDNFYTLFGYHKDQPGTTLKWWEDQIHSANKGQVFFELSEMLQQKQNTFSVECRFRTEDGTYRFVRISAYLFYSDDGKAARMIGSMQDIDQFKQNEELLTRQNNFLRELAFTHSHELRRPVASILGLNSLIQEILKNSNPPNNELQELITYLDEATHELDSMIKNSIEKMNRIEKNL